MTVHDRIRLTGVLRESPAPAGLFYGPVRETLGDHDRARAHYPDALTLGS